MRIPPALLRHTVQLEPRTGADANGPLYGPPAPRRAYVEATRRSVRQPDGRVIVAGTVVWVQLDRTITSEWRLTHEGRLAEIVSVDHFEGRLGTPDHTQITCQ